MTHQPQVGKTYTLRHYRHTRAQARVLAPLGDDYYKVIVRTWNPFSGAHTDSHCSIVARWALGQEIGRDDDRANRAALAATVLALRSMRDGEDQSGGSGLGTDPAAG